jgi:TolA-binding protein
MKHRLRLAAGLLSLASITLLSSAQSTITSDQPTASRSKKASRRHTPTIHTPTIQEQLLQMQKEMQEQNAKLQMEIESLRAQLNARQDESKAVAQTAQAAQEKATAAQAQADATSQQNAAAVGQLRDTVNTQNTTTTAAIEQVKTEQVAIKKQVEEPASLHYKGVTLTPGGFLAGESVWRQRALNADLYTNFNSTPYPGADEAHTSEWVPSARQSRLSLLASGKVPFGTIRGYFEGDFLSAGITSNSLQTNSYTMRVRQAWGQGQSGHFLFTAGQMWTLLTEDKKAALPGQEALPINFDANPHVGFTYVRQTAFRAQETLAPGVNVAIALEGSQYQFSASNAPTNFFFGSAGASGGLNNSTANYTNQVAPDVLAKVTFDLGFGHYEIGGVARFFRDRVYPAGTTAADAQNNTKLGGGFVANARFPVLPKVDLGLHLVAGDGTGRYGASLLPDITVKPDGTLEPLRNAQGLISLEVHPARKLDLFGYAGTEYVQRTYYRNAAGILVGYAPPTASNAGCFTEPVPTAGTGYAPGTGTCLGATRDLAQGSIGYIYRIYTGPAGKLQFGMAYSYLTKSGWSGVGGAPKAVNNLVYTSVRYYIP